MSTTKPLVEGDVVASTLRALGVAVFAGIAVVAGVGLKWLILSDNSYSSQNLAIVNFSIALAGLVATGALTMVALKLATWPERRP